MLIAFETMFVLLFLSGFALMVRGARARQRRRRAQWYRTRYRGRYRS